ncbi:MAG TPA: metallophosphoesterase [Levilinea sp.]|nr:metallophosphoesterase [Levilinea sp.]
MRQPAYVLGDVHGQYDKVVRLLTGTRLLNADLTWNAANARLWFIGDFFDRGPGGLDIVNLVMALQPQAAVAGGEVGALIGNHEILLLAARRFGERPTRRPGGTFTSDWLANGGVAANLAALTSEHIEWLSNLPAMALVQRRLLIHADANFYNRYGHSIEEVNHSLRALLHSNDAREWERLLDHFSERDTFFHDPKLAVEMLTMFGGRQIIHGHTPISLITGETPHQVVYPVSYAGGLCLNVDGGMYGGGWGFVYRLPALRAKNRA